MSDPAPANALVQRILQGEAPMMIRAAAARGALPLPRAALVRLFVHLLGDPDEQVRADATASLAALDSRALRDVLSDRSCSPEVLAHFAPAAARDEALAEAIAFHPDVPVAALGVLASGGNAAVIDLVLTNQERILSNPELVDRLSANPALRQDQRGRVLDLLASCGDDGGSVSAPDAGAAVDEAEAAALLAVDVGELYASSEIADGDEFATAEDPRIRSVYRKILTLTTAQKAMLGMKGGREERSILVRDTNKVVASSVLKNPRLTDSEVESIASMRNVSDDVLRAIGANREWSKSYGVMAALVRNPKTPPGVATNFIPLLNNRDLKGLAHDKNVPEIIRRNAKRTYDLRTQKTDSSRKK